MLKTLPELVDAGRSLAVDLQDYAASQVPPPPPPDITAPDTVLISGPSNSSNPTARFEFGAIDDSVGPFSYEGRLSGGGWSQIVSPLILSGLAEGVHTYEIRVTDPSGNVDPTPIIVTWTRTPPPDVTPPDTVVVSGPKSSTATFADIAFSGSDDRPGSLSFEGRLNNAPWGPVVSPLHLDNLVPGDYVLEVVGIDAAGNRDATPATFAWSVLAEIPPGPPPAGRDPMVIYDGPSTQNAPGTITGLYLYYKHTAWANKGGDHVDADGVPQGSKPFGELTVKTGQSGPFVIDITSAIKQGVEPQLAIKAIANSGMGPRFFIGTKDAGTGAKLDIAYQDGTSEILPVMYDACADPSTAYSVNTLTLDTATKGYLRFPAPPRAVKSAKLVLAGSINTGGRLCVFLFAIHRQPIPSETFTLDGNDPRCFLHTECFEDAPYYVKAKMFGGPAPAVPDAWNQTDIVPIGGGDRALQVTFDPRGSSALNASVCFPNFDEASEVAYSYKLRLLPDMTYGMRDGFKMAAGLTSFTKNDDAYFAGWSGMRDAAGATMFGRVGTLLAGNGGSKAHGNDGWSLRTDAMNSPPFPHPLHGRFMPTTYAYWPGQSDFYGDQWEWDLQQQSLIAGEWYEIAQRCKINDCVGINWQNNAELDCYINGGLAMRKRNVHLRETTTPLIELPPYLVPRTDFRIGRVWFNAYHGGTSVPLARCSLQLRDFKVAKYA